MTERVAGGSAGGWVAALAAASVALLFAGSPASAARDGNVACVQAFLDFSRYDVGPMDGTLSKETLAAVRSTGSTDTARMADRSITIPPSHTAVPATL